MTPIEKVRAALEYYAGFERNIDGTEDADSIKQYAPRAKEALSELDGMVLVPVEPTEAMLECIWPASIGLGANKSTVVAAWYEKMIAPYVKGE